MSRFRSSYKKNNSKVDVMKWNFRFMEFLYNSKDISKGRLYILDGICTKIAQNNGEILDGDIRILYQLYGPTYLKAAELISKECIEYITITNTERSYFSVQGSKGFYTIYPRVNFCQCIMFQLGVTRKEKDVMCKHLLACHIALAMKTFKTRNTENLVYTFD